MSIIGRERQAYHRKLCTSGLLVVASHGFASNTDKRDANSVRIGLHLAEALNARGAARRLPGQTAGALFEGITQEYIKRSLAALNHVRPGKWGVDRVGSRLNIADYDQYEHLRAVDLASRGNTSLRVLIGEEYTIASDILVSREALDLKDVNKKKVIIEDGLAKHSCLLKRNNVKPSLHALVSCKWTMRSDRAQNARYEALRLIRSRKGRVPHLVVVTAEPLPGRIQSLALGTGDIACVYHIALQELKDAVDATGNKDIISLLDLMIEGRRLRDIADLPLDLAI